jgi:hypothetical protein
MSTALWTKSTACGRWAYASSLNEGRWARNQRLGLDQAKGYWTLWSKPLIEQWTVVGSSLTSGDGVMASMAAPWHPAPTRWPGGSDEWNWKGFAPTGATRGGELTEGASWRRWCSKNNAWWRDLRFKLQRRSKFAPRGLRVHLSLLQRRHDFLFLSV